MEFIIIAMLIVVVQAIAVKPRRVMAKKTRARAARRDEAGTNDLTQTMHQEPIASPQPAEPVCSSSGHKPITKRQRAIADAAHARWKALEAARHTERLEIEAVRLEKQAAAAARRTNRCAARGEIVSDIMQPEVSFPID